jgi:hypothetical protein
VDNDGVNRVDLLGLISSPYALNNIAVNGGPAHLNNISGGGINQTTLLKVNFRATLATALTGSFGGVVAASAEWPEFIRHLDGVVFGINVGNQWRKNATYNTLFKTINVRNDTSLKTIIHELVHASAHQRGINVNLRQDEGMAYSADAIGSMIVNAQQLYDSLENTNVDGERLIGFVSGMWKRYWMDYHESSSEWFEVEWGYFGKGPLTNSDIELFKNHFGVDYSFQKVADLVNEIPKIRNNCISVICDNTDSGFLGWQFISTDVLVPTSLR